MSTEIIQPHVPQEALAVLPYADVEPISAEREAKLRRLLDGPNEGNHINYDSALRLGLIDMFKYDPKTGEDGLEHVLSGNLIKTEYGEISEGFHHEPSGAFGSSEIPSTVDREHLKELNAKQRSNYKEHPYAPYQAQVSINGIKKLRKQINPQTGEEEVKSANTYMFPKEYDSLTIMQAIRIARQGRDRNDDEIADNGKLVGHGFAPMIDGESFLKIRLIMDPETEKIISAIPVKHRGYMKLTSDQLSKIENGDD